LLLLLFIIIIIIIVLRRSGNISPIGDDYSVTLKYNHARK